MHQINVSEEVWQAIAAKGKFGETEDDVLRRVFGLPVYSSAPVSITVPLQQRGAVRVPRGSFATKRLSSYINGNHLHASFQGGPSRSWPLPPKTDKVALRSVREDAVTFARQNGATIGQINAVKKTLTDSGYHLTR